MITRTTSAGHPSWAQEMRAAARGPEALPATTVAVAAGRDQAHGLFPTRVPAEWLEPGVLTGALARQAFPDG
ncbi:MAG: hypothetical protein AAGE01_17545, partial [Pseudomonadota bacterium]